MELVQCIKLELEIAEETIQTVRDQDIHPSLPAVCQEPLEAWAIISRT
jgi:hypothetical protein